MLKNWNIAILLILSTCFSSTYSYGQEVSDSVNLSLSAGADTLLYSPIAGDSILPVGTVRQSRRVVAVLLCAALGPFGMHRLYLGTDPLVAAAYTFTLGGGFGFVVAVDLCCLLFSKDITQFKNNPRFIMWKRP